MNYHRSFIVIFPFLLLAALVFPNPALAEVGKAILYTCPMHPHYIADQVGTCPICGMNLVPMPADETEPTTVEEKTTVEIEKGITKYTCPMHPHYIADQMGTCPICGMDLVPMPANDAEQSSQHSVESPAENQPTEPQRAMVTIPPETIQNVGVRYGRPERTEFGRRVRAFGMVMENQRIQTMVSSRVAGWVEALSVTAVGDTVHDGMVLYRLFSPELVTAQRDYLSALKQAKGRIDSARQRLRALGVSDEFLQQLRRKRKVMDQVPFQAEYSGIVSVLNIRRGTYVRPGMTIAIIQDYTTVWLDASVAEKDLAGITLDTPVQVMLPNSPGRILNTRIDYIYPTIDPASRTGTVRLVLDNSDGTLRPGAYADVIFEVGVDQRLAVPDSALLHSTDGFYVIRALGEGRFQPVRVRAGLSAGGYTEVLEGITDQDRIVLSGQFLIDSESALRESFRKLQRLKTPLAALSLTTTQQAMTDHLVDAALYIHEGMVEDRGVEEGSLQPARDIQAQLWQQFAETRLGPILQAADESIAHAQIARTPTELSLALSNLSEALWPWIVEGVPEHYRQKRLHVFKESGDLGRLWMQIGNDQKNPYSSRQGVLIFPKDWEEEPIVEASEVADPHAWH